MTWTLSVVDLLGAVTLSSIFLLLIVVAVLSTDLVIKEFYSYWRKIN